MISSPHMVEGDGPDFASVHALAEASDAVIIGVVHDSSATSWTTEQ